MCRGISGAIIAIIRDKQDHVFYYPDEVKKDINAPLLGHLPHIDIFKSLREDKESILDLLKKDNNQDNENSKKNSYQRFFFQEAFRNLYTSIRFLDASEKVKTITLSSSLPKEGKTLANILLAKTIADLGVKVLLVDADLRKPQVHFRLGLNNLLGFSNLLIDPKIEFSKVINKIDNYDNWQVITGGTVPPDPARLLSSQRFKDILTELKESRKFDIILIDSPPVLGLADSLLISEHVDGMIILIGLQTVDRSLPQETINKIKSIGTNLYGVVTNQTKEEKTDFSRSYRNSKYGLYYGGYRGYGGYNYYSTYENYSNSDETEINVNYTSKDTSPSGKENEDAKNLLKKAYKKIQARLSFLLKWLDN